MHFRVLFITYELVCVCVRRMDVRRVAFRTGFQLTYVRRHSACNRPVSHSHHTSSAPLSIACCHVCRMRLCVCLCECARWLITTSPFHLTNRFRIYGSFLLVYFAQMCARVFAEPFRFWPTSFLFVVDPNEQCTHSPNPIWRISNAVKSFPLVRTNELPKQAANVANLHFTARNGNVGACVCSGDAFCFIARCQ